MIDEKDNSIIVPSWAFRGGILLGALAIVLGAFGAHSLKDVLEGNGQSDNWDTAVFYHLVHAVLLIVISSASGRFRKVPWFCITGGIVFFSGSLYVLALTNILWLGAITPIGGGLFILGWASLWKG